MCIQSELFPSFTRSLPDGSAWVLDNFPTSLEQAKVDRQPTIQTQLFNDEYMLSRRCKVSDIMVN